MKENEKERLPVKKPPGTRRRMMPPTSHSLMDESQWQADLEAQQSIWSARERSVIVGMQDYLDKSDNTKAETEAPELLMDPEDSELCLRFFLTHARRRGSRIFKIYSTQEKVDHLVASVPWKEGHATREVAKRFARRELRRNDGKGSSVLRKKDENAAAAAEFFVEKGGRKPVACSRKDGHCIAGESLEGKSRN